MGAASGDVAPMGGGGRRGVQDVVVGGIEGRIAPTDAAGAEKFGARAGGAPAREPDAAPQARGSRRRREISASAPSPAKPSAMPPGSGTAARLAA